MMTLICLNLINEQKTDSLSVIEQCSHDAFVI